uniref:RNA helicase n=1 Tax=Steinernema glaseri TaxID=37863 RepID=A0A1I7ZI18_9BILA
MLHRCNKPLPLTELENVDVVIRIDEEEPSRSNNENGLSQLVASKGRTGILDMPIIRIDPLKFRPVIALGVSLNHPDKQENSNRNGPPIRSRSALHATGPMASMLYPPTIESDGEEVRDVPSSSDEDENEGLKVRKKKKKQTASSEFDDTFVFDAFGSGSAENGAPDDLDGLRGFLKKSRDCLLQDKIESERKRQKMEEKVMLGDSKEGVFEEDSSDDDGIVQEMEDTMDQVKEKSKKKKKAKKADELEELFDAKESETIMKSTSQMSFHQMNLSRPILKGVAAAGFSTPTPVQATCIPVALAGRDICACAATGTGKTAAFMLPILERLMYKPKQKSVTRVLVLVPTRELAIQVFQVSRKLSQFTNVEICLCAGGLDVKAQEAALRQNPDVVIATPGRLIDHLYNSPNFNLHDIEVLVLDEADRMLEEAFAEQMKELIRMCARNRQTLLFSATMTDEINDLAAMSLSRPVKLFINENTQTAQNLRQEFIRIRENRESDREAVVAALVTRTFPDHTIVFVRTKRDCQRLHILLGLLGVKVGQLHGSLTQTQRVKALSQFKTQEIDVLCSTDLAARGLDIEGVQTVINMNMPLSVKQYVHRVGRTARAGKAGRSISLVGEGERKLLKEIVKTKTNHSLKQRMIAPEVVEAYGERIASLADSVKRIEGELALEKEMAQTESAMEKAENRLDGGTDAEKREWFQTNKQKEDEKRRQKDEYKKKKAAEKAKEKASKTPEDVKLEKIAAFQAREAKRERRNKRIRAIEDDAPSHGGSHAKKKKSSFTNQLTSVGAKSVKKFRHGPDDEEFRKAKRAHQQSNSGRGRGGRGRGGRGRGRR